MGISILKPKSTDDILDSMKNANPSYVLKNSLSRKFLDGVILALKSGSEFSPMEWDDLYTFLSTNRDEFNSSRPSQKFLDKLLKKAAQRPFVDLVKYAIDKGANVNSNDRMGNTALYYAAKAQSLESLKALVKSGAVYSNSIGVINYMFSVGAKLPTDELLIREMLNHTVGSSNMRMLRLLMSKGARPVDFHLHLASARGFMDIVNALIDNGIRPDGKSLGLAAKNWHTGTAMLLVKRGSSIDDAMDYLLTETSVSPDSTIIEFLKSLKHNEKA